MVHLYKYLTHIVNGFVLRVYTNSWRANIIFGPSYFSLTHAWWQNTKIQHNSYVGCSWVRHIYHQWSHHISRNSIFRFFKELPHQNSACILRLPSSFHLLFFSCTVSRTDLHGSMDQKFLLSFHTLSLSISCQLFPLHSWQSSSRFLQSEPSCSDHPMGLFPAKFNHNALRGILVLSTTFFHGKINAVASQISEIFFEKFISSVIYKLRISQDIIMYQSKHNYAQTTEFVCLKQRHVSTYI